MLDIDDRGCVQLGTLLLEIFIKWGKMGDTPFMYEKVFTLSSLDQ